MEGSKAGERDEECQVRGICNFELSVFMEDHTEQVTSEPRLDEGREQAW